LNGFEALALQGINKAIWKQKNKQKAVPCQIVWFKKIEIVDFLGAT
jgi:hypothetical protein